MVFKVELWFESVTETFVVNILGITINIVVDLHKVL